MPEMSYKIINYRNLFVPKKLCETKEKFYFSGINEQRKDVVESRFRTLDNILNTLTHNIEKKEIKEVAFGPALTISSNGEYQPVRGIGIYLREKRFEGSKTLSAALLSVKMTDIELNFASRSDEISRGLEEIYKEKVPMVEQKPEEAEPEPF